MKIDVTFSRTHTIKADSLKEAELKAAKIFENELEGENHLDVISGGFDISSKIIDPENNINYTL